MRIGIVCPYSFDEPGGVQAHILDLATVFIEQGHDVEVLGPAAPLRLLQVVLLVIGERCRTMPPPSTTSRVSVRATCHSEQVMRSFCSKHTWRGTAVITLAAVPACPLPGR